MNLINNNDRVIKERGVRFTGKGEQLLGGNAVVVDEMDTTRTLLRIVFDYRENLLADFELFVGIKSGIVGFFSRLIKVWDPNTADGFKVLC